MNKKVIKIISAVTIILCIILSVSTVFAAIDPKDIPGTGTVGDTEIKTVGNNIATIIRSVGVVMAVVILIFLLI